MTEKGTHSYFSDSRNENVQIYVNGEIYPRQLATISVFDSGFLLGDGVWEGIRLLNNQMVFLDAHLNRLYRGAEYLAIDIGKSKEELSNLIQETLDANSMKNGVHIRLIVSRGLKKTPYQHPRANIGNSSIVIIPEYKIANEEVNENGIRLVTVTIRRGTPDSQDPRVNSLSKQNCISACIEADRAGADEGIMLDLHGNVSTCNSTNFFIVRNTEVWTSTGQYCLPGVTRQAVIDICLENDIPMIMKDFRIMDVHSADEAFVTGTFANIIPVKQINNKKYILKKSNLSFYLRELYLQKINKLAPIIQ